VKRPILFIVMVSMVWCATAQSQPGQPETPGAVFNRANALYDGGEYEQAAQLYERLVDAGLTDASLFYNLGNSYYKSGAIGRAVLYYERARRLDPRNEDINANLSMARSLLRDRQFIDEAGRLRRVLLWPHRNLSTRETFALTSLWYLLLTLATLGFILRDSRVVSRIYPTLSMASPGRLLGLDKPRDFALAIAITLVLTAATAASAYSKYRSETIQPDGVVLREEVAVFSGPSDESTLQFKVHEGTVLRIDDERTHWVPRQTRKRARFPRCG
jgi:tetratricopeptide (TPR) repeat protein